MGNKKNIVNLLFFFGGGGMPPGPTLEPDPTSRDVPISVSAWSQSPEPKCSKWNGLKRGYGGKRREWCIHIAEDGEISSKYIV